MGLFSLEHSKVAYRADVVFYAAVVLVVAAALVFRQPHEDRLRLLACAAFGLLSWTLIEYLLHRHVLHGMQPFRRWHAAHHDRPMALICTPTAMSASLIVVLVFLPALYLGGVWTACAVTWGVLTGYLAYTVTHHLTHHSRVNNAWLRRGKARHAVHHHHPQSGCYGVTSGFWDHVFGTARVRWRGARSR